MIMGWPSEDPLLAPRRGPLGPSPDRESGIGNAPALVPGPLAGAVRAAAPASLVSMGPTAVAAGRWLP
jgi:hypothetical protein